MISVDNLTPTERKMLHVLLDNMQHIRDDLINCMGDEQSNCLGSHLYNLRKKLRTSGHTIVTSRINGVTKYQIARIIVPADR